MNAQQQGRGSGDDDNVLSAWQAQLAKVARDAGGIKGKLDRERELLPSFAEH